VGPVETNRPAKAHDGRFPPAVRLRTTSQPVGWVLTQPGTGIDLAGSRPSLLEILFRRSHVTPQPPHRAKRTQLLPETLDFTGLAAWGESDPSPLKRRRPPRMSVRSGPVQKRGRPASRSDERGDGR